MVKRHTRPHVLHEPPEVQTKMVKLCKYFRDELFDANTGEKVTISVNKIAELTHSTPYRVKHYLAKSNLQRDT